MHLTTATMHFYDAGWFQDAAIIVGWLLIVTVATWRGRRKPPSKIVGWWHYQHPGRHHWMPQAWASACDRSLEKSRERRNRGR